MTQFSKLALLFFAQALRICPIHGLCESQSLADFAYARTSFSYGMSPPDCPNHTAYAAQRGKGQTPARPGWRWSRRRRGRARGGATRPKTDMTCFLLNGEAQRALAHQRVVGIQRISQSNQDFLFAGAAKLDRRRERLCFSGPQRHLPVIRALHDGCAGRQDQLDLGIRRFLHRTDHDYEQRRLTACR
jgi:hypothetical protein